MMRQLRPLLLDFSQIPQQKVQQYRIGQLNLPFPFCSTLVEPYHLASNLLDGDDGEAADFNLFGGAVGEDGVRGEEGGEVGVVSDG